MIISFVSAKGGAGKTSLAASSAKVLSNLGLRILLLDLDSSTNGLTLLFLEKVQKNSENQNISNGCNEIGQIPNVGAHVTTIDKNLDFLPFSYEFNKKSEPIHYDLLKKRIQGFSQGYDVIIIDAQAGTDNLSKLAVDVSEKCVIVTEFDPMSASGVERMRFLFSDVMPPEKTSILVNKMLPQFIKNYQDFFSIFHHVRPMPFDFDAIRAYAKRDIAINLEEPNPYTLAIVRTLSDIVPEYKNKFDDWKKVKTKQIIKPLKSRLDDTDKKIDDIQNVISEKKFKSQYLKMRMSKITSLVAAMAGMITLLIIATSQFQELDLTYLITILLIPISLLIGIIFLMNNRNQEKILKSEQEYHLTSSKLESELSKLFEDRTKLQSLIDSDIDELLDSSKTN